MKCMIERALLKNFILTPNGSDNNGKDRYIFFSVEIPGNISKVKAELRFACKSKVQLPIALYDSGNSLRGIKVNEYSEGLTVQNIWTAVGDASHGAVPGPIPKGKWKIVIYKRFLLDEIECMLTVDIENEISDKKIIGKHKRKQIVLDSGEKWYGGELHMHSTESTGRTDVEKVVEIARNNNLDFIAITDHFTIAHWGEIDRIAGKRKPLLIHSCELSGERGHANLHGIQTWIDPFVDGSDSLFDFRNQKGYSMNTVADIVHEQGGLFCINHPLSGKVGWRYNDFDVKKADLIEVVGMPDGPNGFLYPVLWDRFLCIGQRLTGIGSSDSHDPESEGAWKLGVLRTWVYAEDLSEKSIIKGLKRGRVCITHGAVRMDFYAVKQKKGSAVSRRYEMGDTVYCREDEQITCTMSLKNHPRGNIYAIKDGFIFDTLPVKGDSAVNGDWEDINFEIEAESLNSENGSYCRVEFHEELVEPYYVNMAYRDHTSLRALSNPVWMSKTGNKTL